MRRDAQTSDKTPNPSTFGRPKRLHVNFKSVEFDVYHLQGVPQIDVSWYNLSYDEATGEGFFLFRFGPNSRSIPHEHVGYEEFVVLEGEIMDSDGTVFRAGDCVSQRPGSKHFSTSITGATTAVFVRGGFRTLKKNEAPKS